MSARRQINLRTLKILDEIVRFRWNALDLEQSNNAFSKEPLGRQTRIAGALLFSSGLIFTIFNTIAESIYPNYNIGQNALSDLGALGQSTALLWDGQLLISGIITLLGMWLLVFRSAYNQKISKPAKILFLLPAIGVMIVSLFPENTILAIHSLGALLNFLAGGLAAIYSYKFSTSPFRYFAVLLGIVSLSAIPFLGSHPVIGFGGVERLVAY
ncbi:MAG: DUF998 domain-containing protein, partial [Nitrososphaerales archaeon]